MVVGATINSESGSCHSIGPHILLSCAASRETLTTLDLGLSTLANGDIFALI